ncbi:LytTR family DNA-binding domain-containing protein [Paraflavisolibacter sp. H34]|uniref:LytTR family DNA-binding domain-containing protein n=1 Tax=Huijunlia imazamoxiresistens TaxID=3127457 RepID=UPI003018E154
MEQSYANMILQQPFPLTLPAARWRFPLIAGFIVFLIIYLYRPFELSTVKTPYFFLHALCYGLGTFATAALNAYLLPVVFPRWFVEERWTLGRELLLMAWQVFSISFTNMAITYLLYRGNMSFLTIFDFLYDTTVVGLFPVTIIVLIKYILLLRRNQTDALVMDLDLKDAPPVAAQEGTFVTLTGDNQNDVLKVPVDSIYFISSADNYIKVFFEVHDRLASKVLRGTLKKAKEALDDYPQFFRCHRSYLVNLKRVERVSGNAQGLKLHLQHAEETVPVSRNLNDALRFHLQQQKSPAVQPGAL